jgi:hypothetical protein
LCFLIDLKINIPRIKYRHKAMRRIRRRIPTTITIHAQHGQSAFNPRARIRLNEPFGTSVSVV